MVKKDKPPKAGKKKVKILEGVKLPRKKGVGSKIMLLYEGRRKEYTIIDTDKTGFYCIDKDGWRRYHPTKEKKAKAKVEKEGA